MKNLAFALAFAGLVLAYIVISLPDTPTVASEAIHWHARVEILINSQDIPIPANVGLSETRQEVQHTHDWDNVIHIEAVPSEENLRLGKFFEIWAVRFTKNCLFQFCNEDMRMFVNGEESFDFDDYIMQDGDEILITVRSF